MEREAFRLQQHQSYAGVKGPEWEAWQAGKPLPMITPETHPFQKKIAGHTVAGRRVYQVHIIEWPLAEYKRYAFKVIQMCTWDGSEFFLVERDAHPDLATLTEDFWMFDEQRIAVMHYDEQERFVEAAEPTEPIETYPARRDLTMKYAMPFEQWMAEHRDRLGRCGRISTGTQVLNHYAISQFFSIFGTEDLPYRRSYYIAQTDQEVPLAMTQYEVLASDCPPGMDCPKVARGAAGVVTIVGRAVTDPVALVKLGVGPGESAVEITETLFRASHDSLEGTST